MNSKLQKFVTTGGTVACALAIGFFMQRGETPQVQQPKLAPEPIKQAVLTPSAATPSIPAEVSTTDAEIAIQENPEPKASVVSEPLDTAKSDPVEIPQLAEPETLADSEQQTLEINEITLTSADVPVAPIDIDQMLADLVAYDPDAPVQAPEEPTVPHLGCDVMATASAVEMAIVKLSIEAPCNANERVTIHHTGMMFTDVTDESGSLIVNVPAMTAAAVFVVELDSGRGAIAQANVPEVEKLDRVALQWKGVSGFQIHAREFGAAYGSAGHVWNGHTESELIEAGGFMTRLGDESTLYPNLVEVYTFPTGAANRSGTVLMTVETEVTDANCGRDIAAQSIELRSGMPLKTQDLVLSMPDCSAKGDFLVLNNLVDDLKIAAN